jgi:3-phytase
MKNNVLLCGFAVIVIACTPPQDPQSASAPSQAAPQAVHAVAETAPSASSGANDPALLLNAADSGASLILATTGEGGIEAYALDGSLVGTASTRPSTFIDVRYNFPLGEHKTALIVANDSASSELVAYAWDKDERKLTDVSTSISLGMEVEGLCLYRSPVSQKLYTFVVGSGWIEQWELFVRQGQVAGRLTRTVPVGLGAAHCAVSDRDSAIYFSQETVGVAVLNAEPESEAEVSYIDFSEPHGRFSGDVKGVALYEHSDGGYLIVSDADVSRLQVYDMRSREYIGALSVEPGDMIDGVQETEGLLATSMTLTDNLGGGMLVLADDDNGEENTNFKIVAWRDIATTLGLPTSTAYNPSEAVPATVATASPSAQTEPVKTFGDAADDPAIWVHPNDPAQSVIIGTQKKLGINVYDMSGKLLQSRADGRINNVDLRYGFMLGDESVDVVTASNRSSQSIGIWKVDPATRTLIDVANGTIPTEMGDPYGACMYKSPANGAFYVFINDTDGLVKQWQLQDAGNGRIGASVVREFSVGSQTEGCVADDELGHLYIGEENAAIWKYSAEPDGGDARTQVDNTDSGHLTADVEGLSIYYGANSTGYLVASNQGADNYVIYERQGDNRYLGHFHVIADEATGIDGASETDGLDVTSANLGPAFPNGALIVQDGRNISPVENQNFKIVPWERVAAALQLNISSGYDPRATQ